MSSYVEQKDTREVIDIDKLNAEIKQTVANIDRLRAEIDKIVAEELLKNAGISPDARAEDLAIEDWKRLLKEWLLR